jgi:siroheme synthase
MGLSNAGAIAEHLIDAGLAGSTPAAIIQNGTREDQEVSVGILANLGKMAARHVDAGPALLVIGGVVTLSDAWEEAAAPQKVASW